MRVGAVIVAAGRGERLGHSLPKALVPLAGEPLVAHCLRTFASVDAVAEIVVVTRDEDRDAFERVFDQVGLAPGRASIVRGGERRQDSVLNGVRALSNGVDGALVHDAARPFVEAGLVARLAEVLEEVPAAVPVVAPTSTVKRRDPDREGFVADTVDRDSLALAQTPQAARRALLVEALERADRDGIDVTDDVQAMELAGHDVRCIPDSRFNFKVTEPADLALAEAWLASRRESRPT